MSGPSISISGRNIGAEFPTYVIAEISANHNHSLKAALELIEVAKSCGVDAVKLQTYTADTLTIDCDTEWFRVSKGTLWEGRKLYDLYEEAHTPWDWHAELFQKARDLELTCFSTPFDRSAVELLESLDAPAYKIASFELIDHELLEAVAGTGKPVIMSTGMATLSEIDAAVSVLREAGCEELALLKCTSAYPAPAEEMNLRTIPNLSDSFGVVSGLSDHTMGIEVPVAAVALGARIIEKHFTLSRDVPGPDSAFSLEPDELSELVSAVRKTEQALGRVSYQVTEREEASRSFRRSLFVVADVKAGDVFSRENVRSIRPGYGMAPECLPVVLGRRASRDIKRGTPLNWEMVG